MTIREPLLWEEYFSLTAEERAEYHTAAGADGPEPTPEPQGRAAAEVYPPEKIRRHGRR